MIEEESEVFEITDFTTASDWERFIAQIEEVIHDWKLASQNVSSLTSAKKNEGVSVWQETSLELTFAGSQYILAHHYLSDGSPEQCDEVVDIQDEMTASRGALSETEESKEVFPETWQQLMSTDDDFPSRAHCIYRWYGVKDFILLQPVKEDLTSESKLNFLLSSLAIAQHNTGCCVPILVQLHEPWRRLYRGQFEATGFRTTFEMVHLKTISDQNHFLTGLLDIFKSKLASPMVPLPPVNVAVRFTYVLQEWPDSAWPFIPPDVTANDRIPVEEFGILPLGPCEDPVEELHLAAVWPSLSEEMVVESEVYSDLDPCQAAVWTVKAKMTESPQCLLSDYLLEFIRLCWRTESTDELLKHSLIESETEPSAEVSQALQRLTDPLAYSLPSLPTVVTRATSRLAIKPEEAPIATDVLNEILLFLFPDAQSATSQAACAEPAQAADESVEAEVSSTNALSADDFREIFRQLKSAPVTSLTHRLAICMCIVNHRLGGVRAVAHLWQEVVLEMRYRWDHGIRVIDIESGTPNLGNSLMQQKFQMLNCCIEHKTTCNRRSRTSTATSDSSSPRRPSSSACDDTAPDKSPDVEVALKNKAEGDGQQDRSDDEDEFFECNENESDAVDVVPHEVNDEAAPKRRSGVSESEGAFVDSADMKKPEGRLKPLDELRLLNLPNEKLYVPVTQEPAPMTEDMLEEQTEILARLGTSPEGAHLRARMQSACLLSDMEAFKAANPGCCLGDFVRWYSPRDWVTGDDDEVEAMGDDAGKDVQKSKGHLSHRMQIPGNTWLEAWQMAQALPVSRQRRLFDDTKEAEKVLRWFALLRPADVACRLMPSLVHAAILTIMQQEESRLPIIQSLLTSLSTKATKILRQARTDIKQFEELVKHLSACEVLIIRAQSLKAKLLSTTAAGGEESSASKSTNCHKLEEELKSFLSDVLEKAEVSIPNAARGALGLVLKDLFVSVQQTSNSPTDMKRDSSTYSMTSSKSLAGFPPPLAKEYIFRTYVKRPAPWSRLCPQRMFCVIMKDDFRLAGAFTADTTFQ